MTDLADEVRAAFRDEGVQELIVRVSRYDENGTAAVQAVVKRRDAPKGPWGVGVRTDAAAAVRAALVASRRQTAGEEDIFA